MSQLHSLILQEIKDKGSITVKRFMELALYHPEYGYYVSEKVLGKQGDYITAPELTQVFGELLALWFVDLWHRLGKPECVQLVELGPGRGLMMQDMLRIFKKFPDFFQNLDVYLMEVSSVLMAAQQAILKDERVCWVTDLKDLPENKVTFFVANEFFDALPIEQYVENEGDWVERCITSKDSVLVFDLSYSDLIRVSMDPRVEHEDDKMIKETCPAYGYYMQEITRRLLKNRGGAIIIDYGDDVPVESRVGDTLQALYQHKRTDVLENPGEQDLTHHVSFAALKHYIDPSLKTEMSTQSDFLFTLGLEQWVEKLCLNLDPENAAKLKIAVTRLVTPREMGRLFKVLIIE